jgi:hypothetical protein
MAKQFCLECATVYYKTIEAERLIEQWKTYAGKHGLSPAVRDKGITKRTPVGHGEAMCGLIEHTLRNH